MTVLEVYWSQALSLVCEVALDIAFNMHVYIVRDTMSLNTQTKDL